MRRCSALLSITTLGLLITAPALAQGGPGYNRRIEAVSCVPTPGAPAGQYDVGFVLSVEVDQEPSAPLNLGTEVDVIVNGVLIHQHTWNIMVNPGTLGGCADACGNGEPCTCYDDFETATVYTCGHKIILPNTGTSEGMEPGDQIMVILREASGAMPEFNANGDTHSQTFEGDPLFWHRRIASVSVQPSTKGDSFFDIWIEPEASAQYDGVLALGAELELQVNGVPMGTIPAGFDDLIWNQCLGDCGQPCAFDAAGGTSGTCLPGDFGACNCGIQPDPIPIPGVLIEPDDVLIIVLRPVPGALPELPGFPEDDTEMEVDVCPADLDGDGFVTGADLGVLLGNWGPCDDDECPGDLNDDDTVDGADLGLMLGAWGACFPV